MIAGVSINATTATTNSSGFPVGDAAILDLHAADPALQLSFGYTAPYEGGDSVVWDITVAHVGAAATQAFGVRLVATVNQPVAGYVTNVAAAGLHTDLSPTVDQATRTVTWDLTTFAQSLRTLQGPVTRAAALASAAYSPD